MPQPNETKKKQLWHHEACKHFCASNMTYIFYYYFSGWKPRGSNCKQALNMAQGTKQIKPQPKQSNGPTNENDRTRAESKAARERKRQRPTMEANPKR